MADDGWTSPARGVRADESRYTEPTDELAGEVTRLARSQQECVQRIGPLKAALPALVDDLGCRVKAQEPLATALRDLPTVRRAAHEALDD